MKQCGCKLKDVTREVDEDHPNDVVEGIIGKGPIDVPKRSSISFRR